MTVKEKDIPSGRVHIVEDRILPSIDTGFIKRFNFFYERIIGSKKYDVLEDRTGCGGRTSIQPNTKVIEFNGGEGLVAIQPAMWARDKLEVVGDVSSMEICDVQEDDTYRTVEEVQRIVKRVSRDPRCTTIYNIPLSKVSVYYFARRKGFAVFAQTLDSKPAAMFVNKYAQNFLADT